MGKAPVSDSIMATDRMKPLLALSKREPVQAAIGLTGEGEGLILLDKKAKPKKVFSMLKASAAKSKISLNTSSLRFGRAEVDTDYDSGMVRFFINKDAPGNMRIRLLEVVKRIPYQKVEINVDPTLEEESEEDEDTQDGSAGAVPLQAEGGPDAAALARELAVLARRIPEASASDQALKARLVKLATDANGALRSNALNDAAGFVAGLREALDAPGSGNGQATPGGPTQGATPGASGDIPVLPPPPPPVQDAGALTRELAALARQIPGVPDTDRALKANLVKIATDANTNIRSGNLAAAADLIARLREALRSGGASSQPVIQIWNDAKEAVDQQLDQLYSALKKTGIPVLDEVAGKIEQTLESYRTGLTVVLMNYDRGNGQDKVAARMEASKTVAEFRARVAADSHLLGADTNPFGITVTAQSTLGAALDQLAARLAAG